MLNLSGQHKKDVLRMLSLVGEGTLCCQTDPASDSEECKTNLQTMSKKNLGKAK